MCGLPAALVGLSAVGGLASTVSTERIGRANAALARNEAAQVAEIGKFNEMRARDRMARLIAQQRGQIAARGVVGSTGAALDLGEEAGQERALEAQAQRYNTASRVTAKRNEAAIADYGAVTSAWNGVFNTGARVLTQSLDLWPGLAG